MRLNEVLSLHREEIDLDNLLITVRNGKGGRQRVVPFSLGLRRTLYNHMRQNIARTPLVLYAADGSKMMQNNVRRDFARICHRVGFKGVKGGYHVLRHTFAVNYIRNGGDVFRLQRILGHSDLSMTRRYVDLQTDDLQQVHERFSILAKSSW
jgi:site-specific recombinase XerD